MSKGSKPRPLEIPREDFENKWDLIFGKRTKNESSSSNTDNRINDTDTMRGECTESNEGFNTLYFHGW